MLGMIHPGISSGAVCLTQTDIPEEEDPEGEAGLC